MSNLPTRNSGDSKALGADGFGSSLDDSHLGDSSSDRGIDVAPLEIAVANVLSNVELNEDLALAFLQRPDVPGKGLEQFGKQQARLVAASRKVKLALVRHPKTPRRLSLSLMRHLFTFDLMQVALAPVTPADVKKRAEAVLLDRVETVSLGERISLARRGSTRIAGALLADADRRVFELALENPHLTEVVVIRALSAQESRAAFVHCVCHHPRWSVRPEVQVTLLRNEHTPIAQAVRFAKPIPASLLREILRASALPEATKAHLLEVAHAESLPD